MAENEEKIEILERKEYIAKQKEEACSEKNRFFANERLHKETSDDEAFIHYTLHGGAEEFAKKHKIKDVVEQRNQERQNQQNQT